MLVMMLAYWRLTELPPVGAMSVAENNGALWAYALVNIIGMALDAVT